LGSPVKQKRGGSSGRRLAVLQVKTERRRPQSSPAMLRSFDGQKPMRHAHEDDFLQKIETGEVKRNVATFKREKHVCKEKFEGVDLMADSYFYDLKVLHNGGQRAKAIVARRSLEATAAERMVELCGTMKGDVRRAFDRWSTEPNGMSPELAGWMESQGLIVEDPDAKKKRDRQELMASFGNMFKTVHNECEADHKAAGIPSLGSTQTQDVEVSRASSRVLGASKESDKISRAATQHQVQKQKNTDLDRPVA